jgi:hypothetical protein
MVVVTCKAILHFALRRATIAIHQVSVVAVFPRIQITVAAGRGAGQGLAATVLADRLLGAGLGAAFAVAVEQAIHGLATTWQVHRVEPTVTLFAGFELAVTTKRPGAGLARRGALGRRLHLAGARTPVAAGRVTVVAGFRTKHLAVPAKGRALFPRHTALVADFNGLATGGAAVASDGVAVIAGFRPDQNAAASCLVDVMRLIGHTRCNVVVEGKWRLKVLSTCLLVWQPMVLPGRWPLESLQPQATSALPTAHARSARATHLRAVPRASGRWAFRGQTRPSTLNEGSGASGARLHQELAAWYGLRPNAQRNPQDLDETRTTRLGQ